MKQKKPKHFICPDVGPLISELLSFKRAQDGVKAELIEKWISQLEDIRDEMHKLEKFESLTTALSDKKPTKAIKS